MSDDKDDKSEEEASTAKGKPKLSDFQKTHLSKLMSNPEKPVVIPEGPKRKKPKEPPEFVRFYMGSSAGAGSEVFHVYRHLRRRENDRQAIISENADVEDREMEFQEKVLANKLADDEKTSKKRAKRLKKKQRRLEKKKEQSEGDKKATNEEDIEAMNNDRSSVSSDEETDQQSHFTIRGK